MIKTIKKQLKNINVIPIVVATVVAAIFIIFESYYQLERIRLTTDFVSWALSGMAPFFKMGNPYTNYWGINPPGLLMFTALWGVIVGSTLQSFHALYILLLIAITYLTWKITSRLFKPSESLLIFIVFLIFFFSRTVQTQFFPSEINGLTMALLGFYLVLKNKVSGKNVFLACFYFILAGQMKEVFAFTGLALFPHLLKSINKGKKEFIKFSISALLGVVFGLVVIFGYLLTNQAVDEYKNITSYKSSQFSVGGIEYVSKRVFHSINFPKLRFVRLKYDLPVLLIVGMLSAAIYISLESKVKAKNRLTVKLPKQTFKYSIFILFYIGSLIGSTFQGRYGNKYEIQSIIPTILLISLTGKIILTSLLKFINIKLPKKIYLLLSLAFIGTLIFPNKDLIEEYRVEFSEYNIKTHYFRWMNLENEGSLAMETHIKDNTSENDCITAVYGWGIGSHYYYSQRKSCSKYFLINILPKTEYGFYQQELIENPPKAIFYTSYFTDMNIKEFEKQGFNFSKVLKECYSQDQEFIKLYWANFEKEKMSECLLSGIPSVEDNN